MTRRQVEALTALDVRNARPGYDPTLERRKAEASGRPGFNPDDFKQPDPAVPFKLRDGKGLFLVVRPTGNAYWVYRFRMASGQPDQMFTIGEAGEGRGQITLTAARDERTRLRAMVARGIHPQREREAQRTANLAAAADSFAAVAEEWYREAGAEWSERYRKQVRNGLDKALIPALGKRPLKSITAADVRLILKARKDQAATASLLRIWTGSIFRYAIAHGIGDVQNDPTIATRRMIKRPKVQHHQPLRQSEIPAFLDALHADTGNRQTAIAGELLLLTFTRPAELCGAKWAEFNIPEALWTVPASRMKMKEAHYVPLSARALELLAELQKLTGNREHLFPNERDPKRPMDQGSLNRLFQRINPLCVVQDDPANPRKVSPHSCRATASTILNGLGFNRDWIERQLAHKDRDAIRATYNSAEYLPQRRTMMEAWAERVMAKPETNTNVVPIRAEAAA